MARRGLGILAGMVLLAALACLGFVLWAERPAISAIAPPPPARFGKAAIARGAMLVSAGYCGECHTARGGRPFAGGYPVPTPYGTIYGSNITPDPRTGIGRWPEAAFARAMQQGISRDGDHLYPAFPYTHFTRVSDGDIRDIYAYLMTRPPVHHRVPPPRLPFPLDIRLVMAGWNLVFFDAGRFRPEPKQSAAWNRGAYLAEGLGHCNACHGPRNWLGAEASPRYGGGRSEGWSAFALNGASPAPAPWSRQTLAAYLTGRFAPGHGVAAGPMAGVARNLRKLSQPDIDALAAYVLSLKPTVPAGTPAGAAASAHEAAYRVTTAQAVDRQGPAETGQVIFAGVCASCHFEGGGQPFYRPVSLGLSSAVNAPDPRDFVNIVTQGIEPPPGMHGRWMPPFGPALSDRQIVLLAAYVRGHFSGKPAWRHLGKTVSRARKGSRS